MADTKIETKVTVTCEIPASTPASEGADALAYWAIKEQARSITIEECRGTLSDAFHRVDPDKRLTWDCHAATQIKMKQSGPIGVSLDEIEEVMTTCTGEEKSPDPEVQAAPLFPGYPNNSIVFFIPSRNRHDSVISFKGGFDLPLDLSLLGKELVKKDKVKID